MLLSMPSSCLCVHSQYILVGFFPRGNLHLNKSCLIFLFANHLPTCVICNLQLLRLMLTFLCLRALGEVHSSLNFGLSPLMPYLGFGLCYPSALMQQLQSISCWRESSRPGLSSSRVPVEHHQPDRAVSQQAKKTEVSWPSCNIHVACAFQVFFSCLHALRSKLMGEINCVQLTEKFLQV